MPVLIIAPKFERVTQITNQWSKALRGDRLDGKEAIRKNFEAIAENYDPIIFYSHGNKRSIIGNDRKPLLDRKNVDLIRGKNVYAMACLTCRDLGVNNYADRYLGYYDEFSFTIPAQKIFGAFSNSIATDFYRVNFNPLIYSAKFMKHYRAADTTTRMCMLKDISAFRQIRNSGLNQSILAITKIAK